MNEAGRNALRQAALNGVKQITGMLRDAYGGRCAMGVLAEASGTLRAPHITDTSGALPAHLTYDLTRPVAGCPLCPAGKRSITIEAELLVHANDFHRFDFLKLAEWMPVSEGAP